MDIKTGLSTILEIIIILAKVRKECLPKFIIASSSLGHFLLRNEHSPPCSPKQNKTLIKKFKI